MYKKGDKQQKRKSNESAKLSEQNVIIPTHIQQQYAHLQSMLMLTQLNSAYYQMHLTLLKNLYNLQNRYYSLKMSAFAIICNYKHNLYEARTKQNIHFYPQIGEYGSSILSDSSQKQIHSSSKIKHKVSNIVQQTFHETQVKVIVKSKKILSKMVKIMTNKAVNSICFSFYQMLKTSNENSTLKILSDKSSKIETIDSHKNKIFKRSSDKKISKKSFSVEKSITSYRENFIPIKYQSSSSKGSTPVMSSQSSRVEEPNVQEVGMTDFAKFLLQKHTETDRRNLLSTNRQRKSLKISSSKKYNVTVFVDGKEEKLKELEYLQKKYKKIMTEFNWFSERFLKVIEEEAI